MSSIDEEWNNYLIEQRSVYGMNVFLNSYINTNKTSNTSHHIITENETPLVIEPTVDPICDELYISTNTKLLYLNQMIDTYDIFWKIPIIEYWRPHSGVVHKNMKVVSTSREMFEDYQKHLESVPYYRENIIKQIDIVNSKRPKFKDERKILIGVDKKDILNMRKQQKKAFMNCFSIVIRFMYDGLFREIHVKIFNTGNLEVPGVINMELLSIVKTMVLEILQPHVAEKLCFIDKEGKSKSVLINSNFRCGFFIDRDAVYSVLRSKYNIDSAYDPCSYPGVKCKFYFNNEIGFDNPEKQNGTISVEDRKMTITELDKNTKYTEMTFTLFRTGSCLISGNCSEEILHYIYNFVKNILKTEYNNICFNAIRPITKEKKSKIRKKITEMTPEYYSSIYPVSHNTDNASIKSPRFT
jgi:hypothetical protein